MLSEQGCRIQSDSDAMMSNSRGTSFVSKLCPIKARACARSRVPTNPPAKNNRDHEIGSWGKAGGRMSWRRIDGQYYTDRTPSPCSADEAEANVLTHWPISKGNTAMSLGLILLMVIVIALVGGFSGFGRGYGYGYGHGGMGVLGTVLVVVLVLFLLGRV
jgi:hypothetical protein